MPEPACLITGATGLIGRALVPLLSGWRVYATRRPGGTDLPAGIEAVELDLGRPWTAENLPERVDAVVHLAQSPRYREFPMSAPDVFRVNTAAALHLLDFAHRAGARVFVLASTASVYDFGPPRPVYGEDQDLILAENPGFYAAGKLAAEILSRPYGALLAVVILRFVQVYGPNQTADRLTPRLIDSVREGKPIRLSGPDGLRFNPTFVSDAASAVRAAMGLRQSATVNVGGPEALSLRGMAETIGRCLGKTPVFETSGPATQRHYVVDTTRMNRLLGPPKVSFEQGVRAMLHMK